MALTQIKDAVRAGKRVFWKNSRYEVRQDKCGAWLIACEQGATVGLTHTDGVTMNENGADFYIEPSTPATKSKRAMAIFQLAGLILLIAGLCWLAVYCMQNSERAQRVIYWTLTGQGVE